MMAKNVFTQDEVVIFTPNFINLKLDMEKAEATGFKRNFTVTAYPTLFFIDAVKHQLY